MSNRYIYSFSKAFSTHIGTMHYYSNEVRLDWLFAIYTYYFSGFKIGGATEVEKNIYDIILIAPAPIKVQRVDVHYKREVDTYTITVSPQCKR